LKEADKMKVTINMLRKIIKEEFQKRNLQEKQDERKDTPDMDKERRLAVAEALDVLEQASKDTQDPGETAWWITKLGETFGLEPEEEE